MASRKSATDPTTQSGGTQPSSDATIEQQLAAAAGGGGGISPTDPYSLPQGYKYPRRAIVGTPAQYAADQEAIRYLVRTAVAADGWQYVGPKLVDASGKISRDPYDSQTEAFQELVKMDKADRLDFLRTIYKRGFYGDGGAPSDYGWSSADLSATAKAMLYANSVGRTLDSATVQMMQDFPAVKGLGTALRRAAAEDLRSVIVQVFHQQLGRKPSKKDVDRFISAYRSQEGKGQEGGEQPAAAQTVAEQQVEKTYGPEQQAYGFVQTAQMFEQMLRSA